MPLTAQRFLKWLIFISSLVYCSFYFIKCVQTAERFKMDAFYARVQVWIDSSKCGLKEGGYLRYCWKNQSRPVPVEEVVNDDRGHNLFANAVAKVLQRPAMLTDFVLYNYCIKLFAICIVGFVFFQQGYPLCATALIFLATIVGFPGFARGPDVPSSYLGLLLLGFLPPLLLQIALKRLARFFEGRNKVGSVLIIGLCIFLSELAIAFCYLSRLPYGFAALLGLLVSGMIQLVLFLRVLIHGMRSQVRPKRLYPTIASLVLVLIFFLLPGFQGSHVTQIILDKRNAKYDIPVDPNLQPDHGSWHNLFIGLGSVENPWGIKNEDPAGDRWIKQRYLNIRYGSREYFETIGKEYLKLLKTYPSEIAKIYFHKFVNCFFLKGADVAIGLPFGFYLVLALGAILIRLPSFFQWNWVEMLAPGFFFSSLLIFFQGVMIAPISYYIYPCQLGFIITALVLFEKVLSDGLSLQLYNIRKRIIKVGFSDLANCLIVYCFYFIFQELNYIAVHHFALVR